MKRLGYIIFIGILALTASCSSSQSSLNDLRQITAQVNTEGATYGVKEWRHAIKDYARVDRKIAKYAAEGAYSDDEMEEIGRLQAGCLAGFAKGVGRNVTSKVSNIQSFLRGLFDSLSDKEGEE